jgi:2-polyprenyl-3-methyl-5-hydroxy-6-metoxy-1,4-benzoquinol methylase
MNSVNIQDVANAGVHSDSKTWMSFNQVDAFESEGGLDLVAPFPPVELMQNTTGLTENRHFAEHGVAIFEALERVSSRPLNEYNSILDFGVGVGRLARMFHGFKGSYTGVDIDSRHINWVSGALEHVTPVLSEPRKPLSMPSEQFDMIVSISVFTHIDEADNLFYLNELARLAAPGGEIFLTVHGDRAFQRAKSEKRIFDMLSIPKKSMSLTEKRLNTVGFSFIRQDGHLTSKEYEYGIAFSNERFVNTHWAPLFESCTIAQGAIHDFQDIIVLKKR